MARSSIIAIVLRAIAMLFLISFIYLANNLKGKESFGVIAVMLVIINLSSMIVRCGLGQYILKHVPRLNKHESWPLLLSAVTFTFVFSCIVAAGAFWVAPNINTIIFPENDIVKELRYAAFTLPSYSVFYLLTQYLIGRKKGNLAIFLRETLKNALLTAFLFSNLDLGHIVFLVFSFLATATLTYVVGLNRDIFWRYNPLPLDRSVLGESKWFLLTSFLYLILISVDSVVYPITRSADFMAEYDILKRIFTLSELVLTAVGFYAIPRIIANSSILRSSALMSTSFGWIRMLGVLTLSGCAVLIVCLRWFGYIEQLEMVHFTFVSLAFACNIYAALSGSLLLAYNLEKEYTRYLLQAIGIYAGLVMCGFMWCSDIVVIAFGISSGYLSLNTYKVFRKNLA